MLCKCGCGREVKAYRKGYRSFIHGHNRKGLTDIQKVNMIQCLCGCGRELNEFDKRNRKRLYLQGHTHTGKHMSEETKRKIGEANGKRIRRPEEVKRLRWLARQRIGKPLSEEHRLKISFSERARNGWRYIGEYPYEFNDVFKERIRKRENYCCVLCSNPQIMFKRKLHIHHIDLDKKNTIDSNCVTLCFVCHRKIHKRMSKEEGIILLRNLLNQRYGYQYETIYQECAPFQCM
jgi:5-methylcytosine-specific restriction endonuclease McrA